MRYKIISEENNSMSNVIYSVLQNRGIKDCYQYLNLDESVVQNYNDLSNMQEAVQCFVRHYEARDKIIVMPDSDCDGYTSSAALYLYIKLLNPDYPVEYVLHQQPKTHGLSTRDIFIPDDAKLFLIADASTNDAKECNELITSGIDCIVLDHHDADYQEESEEENMQTSEDNNAIVVNNQLSPNYKNKELSGVGIVYRFLQALDEELWENYADNFLDLCAVGNIADLMDMRSFETRYFVNQGLKNINNKFLQALIHAQEFSMHGEITIHNVSWYIAPVINSVTRIGTFEERELLFRAMIEQDEVFAYTKRGAGVIDENIYDRAARISKNVKARQDKQRDKIFEELKNAVDPNDKIVFLESKIADPGLVGLSAMKLANTVRRPVIIVKEIERNGKVFLSGSCRNCDNSPVHDFKGLILRTNKFEFCSGHKNAAGLSIKPENVQVAKNSFIELLQSVDFNNPILCDFIIDANDLTIGFIQEIDRAKWIWGTGVKEPIIAIENIILKRSDLRIQGKNCDSIAFMLRDIKFVKFKMSEDDQLLNFASAWDGDDNDEITLNIIGECSINDYKGILTPQVLIKDSEVIYGVD